MLKKIIFIAIACCIAVTSTACNSSGKTATPENQFAVTSSRAFLERGAVQSEIALDKGVADAASAALDNTQPQNMLIANVSNRKVITSASFEVQTKDYDKTMELLNTKIADTKSFTQSSTTHGDKSKGDISMQMTIRVPADSFNDFKASISNLGNVIGSSENGDDVTADYFDTEARLTVLKAQEKRILELLEKANIEEIIQIEDKLSQIRTEVERLTTVVQRYDDLVSYATISLSIYQTTDYVTVNDDFFTKVGKAFSGSLQLAGEVLQNVALGIIWMIPYILVAAIAFWIGVYINKKRRNQRKLQQAAHIDTIKVQSDEKPIE